MTRDEALAKLRPMEAELRARGIEALYLFGSVARGDAGLKSDVDLLCETDPETLRGLSFYQVQSDLADVLNAEVDFVDRRTLREPVRTRIEPDLIKVF